MPDTNSKLHSKLFFITVMGFLLQYLLNVYLARNFSVALYGDYSIAIKSLEIITSIVLLATDVGAVSILPIYLKANQENSVRTYIAWNIKLIAVNILIARILAVGTLLLVLGLHFLGFREIHDYPMIVFVLWVVPIVAFFTLFTGFLYCYGQALTVAIYKNVVLLVLQIILFFVAFRFFPDSLHPYILICLILLCDYFILTMILYRKFDANTRKTIRFGLRHILRTPISGHESWVNRAKGILTVDIIHRIITPMQLVIVKIFANDKLVVGQYAAILTTCYVMHVISKNFCQQLKTTAVADLTTESGREKLKKKLYKIHRDIFIIIFVTCLAMIIFSKPLLNVFGSEFALAQNVLIIAAIGNGYYALNIISQLVLMYSGHEKLVIKPTAIRLLATIVVSGAAMYRWGIKGMAISSLVVDGSYVFWCNLIASKAIKIKFQTIPKSFRRANL